MGTRKKDLKQRLAEIAYYQPSVEKRAVSLNKSIGEISSLISKKGRTKKS